MKSDARIVGAAQGNERHGDDSPTHIECYRFKIFGTLRVARTGDELWASIRDTGVITGLSLDKITGGSVAKKRANEGGTNGYLVPDGIRYVWPGFTDTAVRLEALPGVFQRFGLRPDLSEWILCDVLPDILGARQARSKLISPPPHQPCGSPLSMPDGRMIPIDRFYSEECGGSLSVRMAGGSWYSVHSVALSEGVKEAVVMRLAGSKGLVRIPEMRHFGMCAGPAAELFVHSAVAAAVNADCHGPGLLRSAWAEGCADQMSWLIRKPAYDGGCTLREFRNLLGEYLTTVGM
jgi:hypothetical protein